MARSTSHAGASLRAGTGPRVRALAAVPLLIAVLAEAPGGHAAAAAADERELPPPVRVVEDLSYRWRLGGLLGQVARLLVPGQGEGALTTRRLPSGHLEVELKATSSGARDGEYWLYGSEIDPVSGRTLRAWTESFFRGRHKRREEPIEEAGVVGIPGAIRRLRAAPPDEPRELLLWSDGKIYPVVVAPSRTELRRVGDRMVPVDYMKVEGRDVPGRRPWRGSLELWLARGGDAEPVEIVYRRRPGRLHLLLDDPL